VPPDREAPDREAPSAPKAGVEPVAPSPHRRAPTRFSLAGVALLGAAAVIALIVTVGIFLPAIGAIGAAAGRDPAGLPARITVCGRTWTKDSLSRTFTRNEIYERTNAEPIVVSTGLMAACPPEVRPPSGGTATVVYAKTGGDAYVPYELAGGP